MRLATLLFCAAAAHAQTPVPDTTAPWRYFPLEVGNRWELVVSSSPMYPVPPAPTHYTRWAIRSDTAIAGVRYFAMTSDRFSLSGMLESRYVQWLRYDTTRAQVMRRTAQGEEAWYWTPCRLDTPFWTHNPCPGASGAGGGYGYVVMGETTSVKSFSFASEDYHLFAAGIGFVRSEANTQMNTGPDLELRYARVGTRVFGAPIPVLPPVVAAEPRPETAALHVSARPNPAAGPLTLSLDVPVAGPVTVEAFDALGRRVHDEGRTLPAGAHALALDAAAWAPGPYVVRVTTAGGVVSTRVVRR